MFTVSVCVKVKFQGTNKEKPCHTFVHNLFKIPVSYEVYRRAFLYIHIGTILRLKGEYRPEDTLIILA